MELTIAIISLITSIIALITSVLPLALNKRKLKKEFEEKYRQLQSDVASALTMCACYYHNPIDLAQMPEHKLPQEYVIASNELRKLGSTAIALSVTIPEREKKLPITKADLDNVSGCLIGLSNSMTTPYNCGVSAHALEFVAEREAEIRKLLHIEKTNS